MAVLDYMVHSSVKAEKDTTSSSHESSAPFCYNKDEKKLAMVLLIFH